MRINRKIFSVSAVLLIFICFLAVPLKVSASETAPGRITIDCGIPGIKWDIYRVADANEDGTLKPVTAFSGYNIPVSFEHREEIQSIARTFESYIKTGGIRPDVSGTCNESGKAVFTDLEEGWYTAVPHKLVSGGNVFESASLMICVSDYKIYSDVWGTDVRVCPKVITSIVPEDIKKKLIIKFEHDPSTPEREKPIVIIIYKDDEEYDRVELNKDNDWTLVFPDIPDDDSDWTIIQEDEPDDVFILYHKETDRTDDTPVDTLIVTHKKHNDNSLFDPVVSISFPLFTQDNPPEVTQVTETVTTDTPVSGTPETTDVPRTVMTEDSGLPQTGQLWWPVPFLFAGGALLIGVGAAVRVKDGDK